MKKNKKHIASIILSWLLLVVIDVFILTSLGAFLYLANESKNYVEDTIDMYTHKDIESFTASLQKRQEENLHTIAKTISLSIDDLSTMDYEKEFSNLLYRWSESEYLSEIDLVDASGKVICSSFPGLIGCDLSGDGRYAALLSLFDRKGNDIEVCQDAPLSATPVHTYLAQMLEEEELLLLMGVTEEDALNLRQNAVEKYLTEDISMYSLGETGYILRADADLVVTACSRPKLIGNTLPELGFPVEKGKEYSQRFSVEVKGEKACAYGDNSLGFFIFYVYPIKEIMQTARETIGTIMVLMALVCLAIYAGVTFLVQKTVVKNVHSVNQSLSRIAEGNLEETLNVRNSIEFDSLSNDINTTVDRLRELIDQAARRIDEELAFAKVIQSSSLPPVSAMTGRKEITLDAYMDTAREVGGDFYDFFLIGKDKVCLVIADVSGKGISAALFMMRSEALIRHRAQQGGTPGEILTDVNRDLCEGNDSLLFVTVWLAIMDLNTGKGMYVNAGHEKPMVRTGTGQFEIIEEAHDTMLGVWDDTEFEDHDFILRPGDCVFVYTDGVTEARNERKEFFGEDRALKVLNQDPNAPVQELILHMCSSISDFVGEEDQSDDITMLCFAYHGPSEG